MSRELVALISGSEVREALTDIDKMIAIFERVAGRKATPQEIEELRASRATKH